MKKITIALFLCLLIGCGCSQKSTEAADGKPKTYGVVMHYVGQAWTEDTKDPVYGCRVYVYCPERSTPDGGGSCSYPHSAIVCPRADVTTSNQTAARKSAED
jgi:uncharacterized protein YceK